MPELKISVLGAGHGGKAMAGYLGALSQHKLESGGETLEVSLWNRNFQNIQPLVVAAHESGIPYEGLIRLIYNEKLKEGEIFRNALFPDLRDMQEKHSPVTHINTGYYSGDISDLTCIYSPVHKVTSSLEKAVSGSDIIMVVLPATVHEEILAKLIPELKKEPGRKQYVVLNPGRTFGALMAYNMFEEAGLDMKAKIPVEAETFVYASRSWNGSAYILGSKKVVEVAAIPHTETQKFVEIFRTIYDQFTKAEHGTFDTTGNNIAVIFHAALMSVGAPLIMEAIRDRRKGIYEEKEYYCSLGTNPLISLQLEEIDRERKFIFDFLGESMGWTVPTAVDWMRLHYGVSATSLAQALAENTAYHGLLYPQSFSHRYYVEDGGQSFVPTYELSQQFGLELPGFRRTAELARLYVPETKIDIFENARHLKCLGIDTYSPEQVLESMIEGKTKQ